MPQILSFNGIQPKIHPEAFIAESAVVIGDVEIAANSSVWYGCVLRGDVNAIRVGCDSNIQDGTVVHVDSDKTGVDYRVSGGGMPTIIGNRVTIGHMALLHACVLEDDSFVGMRATVMDGATVSSGGMLAAGALLTPRKCVPRGEIWSGSPARLFRPLTGDEQSHIRHSAEMYCELAGRYR